MAALGAKRTFSLADKFLIRLAGRLISHSWELAGRRRSHNRRRSTLPNAVTAVSAAPPVDALAHFEAEFTFETDWDVATPSSGGWIRAAGH